MGSRATAYARVRHVFGMGFGELVLVVIVAIVVIGPKDLPKVLKKLGMWSGKLRRMAFDLRSQSGIDDVLRGEGLGKDIAEIRKLARGEIESVSRDIRIDDSPAYTPPDPYVDAALGASFVSEDREHPIVGPDGFDAMPDTSFVYDASFPRSPLDRDPLYRTGSVDGVVPDDPAPDDGDDGETDSDPEEGGGDAPSTDDASSSTADAPSTADGDGRVPGAAPEVPHRAEAPEAEKSAP